MFTKGARRINFIALTAVIVSQPLSVSAQAQPQLLGPNSCKVATANCENHVISVREHSLPGSFSQGADGFKVLNSFPNKLVSAVWSGNNSSRTFDINVQIPSKTESAKVVVEIPTKLIAEEKLSASSVDSLLSALVSAVNEGESSSINAFAEKNPVNTPPGITIVLTKISGEDRDFAASSAEFPPIPTAMTDRLGQKNFRGASQEVTIAKFYVGRDYFSANFLKELKDDQESYTQYHLDPKSYYGRSVELYLQDGELKVHPPYVFQNAKSTQFQVLDTRRDFCTLFVSLKERESDQNGYPVAAIVTLVTGSQHVGPITNGKPSENFSQGVILGFRNSGAAMYSVLGKGYNKSGNGRADFGNVNSIGCNSKKMDPLTVGTLLGQLGKSRATVAYPRANTLEAYIDQKLNRK